MTIKVGVDEQYWYRRSNMMYYKYIDILVKAFAYDARSIIDIGSANTKYIEGFHWISEKYTLDIKNPYSSPLVTAIEKDLLDYKPEGKFDFLTCLQVLEHIPEAEKFAKRLFDISDRVLISVPYLWPEEAEDEHVNDPVDLEKLYSWTGRHPSYSIIVSEPLREPTKQISRRLICYYGSKDKKINYRKLQENVKLLKEKEEIGSAPLMDSITQNTELIGQLQENLNKVREDQKKYYRLMREEFKNFNLDNELKNRKNINNKMEEKILRLSRDIKQYEKQISKTKSERQRIEHEYNKVLNSTSWKTMDPFRKVGKILKKSNR